MLRCCFRDTFSCFYASCENQLVDCGIYQCGTSRSITRNNLENCLRQSRLLKYFTDLQRREGRQLAPLQHDCVAVHQGYHHFIERSGPRKIPGRNNSNHTQWLVDDLRRPSHQSVLSNVDWLWLEQISRVTRKVVH